jgi:ankyrin repeat protein
MFLGTRLLGAVDMGDTVKVENLLKKGANVNATYAVMGGNVLVVSHDFVQSGNTALMHAARIGYLEVVKVLLDHGVNVNAANQV